MRNASWLGLVVAALLVLPSCAPKAKPGAATAGLSKYTEVTLTADLGEIGGEPSGGYFSSSYCTSTSPALMARSSAAWSFSFWSA